MKFETILDAYSLACGKLDYRTQAADDFVRNLRQCDAFRARLEEMYKLKGATRQERTVARACDELGIDYVADWNSPTDPEYEKAYYHGVDVGLEVADPELFGEDHVALP